MQGPIRKCNLPATLIKQVAFLLNQRKKLVQQRDVQHCFVADASGEISALCTACDSEVQSARLIQSNKSQSNDHANW